MLRVHSLLRKRVALLGLAAALGACALKDPPKGDELLSQAAPAMPAPAKWAAGTTEGTVADGWLANFRDAQLDRLVQEALANSFDLRVTAARVEQAAASAKAAGALIYPQVNLMARGGGKMSGDSSGLQGAGVFVNWELDLWGRVRSQQAAGRSQFESAESDAAFARQSVAALVAKSWFLAIEARRQKALADEIVASSGKLLALARDRARVGNANMVDVNQAEAGLEGYRDAALQLAQGEKQALRSLEILAGRYPAASLALTPGLPEFPGPVPIGLPSQLLERRPDVVAGERRVAAAFYKQSEAEAARLPRISLTAGVTSISSDLFVLQQQNNPVTSLGASLAAPIFFGYALQAQVEASTAEQKAAIADYGRISARAFSEVENALSAGFTLGERVAVLKRSVAENQKSLDLVMVRYRVGSANLSAVQQQQLALFGARSALLRSESERLVQRVNLHLALGGSF